MSEFKDIERLLRLKRYEQPPEGYYEEFIERFKERQRSEVLRLSARGLFVERVSTWLYGMPPRQWMLAGGAATIALAAGFYLIPEQAESAPPVSPTEESMLTLEEAAKAGEKSSQKPKP